MAEAPSTKIVPSAFRDMNNAGEEKPRSSNNITKAMSINLVSKFTPTEFQSIIRKQYVSANSARVTNNISAESLLSYFLPVHEEIAGVLFDNDKMEKLAPEIKQAKLIRSSSIMSPNDLQQGKFTYSLEKIPGLSDEAKTKICDFLSDFFNNEMKFSNKAPDWINQCLYGVGCVPFLILPNSYFTAMRKDGLTVIPGNSSYEARMESLFIKSSIKERIDHIDSLAKQSIYSVSTGNENWASTILLKEANSEKIKINPFFINEIASDLDLPETSDQDMKSIHSGLESMVVRFTKKIEEGDVIKLTENPEIIRFATEYRNQTKKRLEKKLNDHFNSYMEYKPDEMVSLNKYESYADKEEYGHPLFLELPAESVIPICVPGNKKEHLGYFILLDEFGQPLKADPNNLGQAVSSNNNLQAAYTAMFGGSTDKTIFQGINYRQYEKSAIKKVFEKLLDQFLKSHLQGIGMDNVSISKSNAISTVMLYRLFENKRTRVLYVPCHLLKYMCFDYRENGTGKSVLEDVHFILSLRITFHVASIMGLARDAINHRTISVNMDPKETNPLALMNQILNMFVDKERMNFTMDPMEISRNIARNAVTIAPSGIKGLSDFKIEKTDTSGSSNNKTPSELLDALDSLFITGLGVPHAALNELGNNEYAKSVITTNLFFSKQTQNDQIVVCDSIEENSKTFITYSPKLKNELLKIIGNYTKKIPNDDSNVENKGTVVSTKPSPDTEQDVLKNNQAILNLIIHNLKVSLPTPNIAHDKAQFSEINDTLTAITTLVDTIYSSELIPSESAEATTGLTIARAYVKRELLKSLIDKIGVVHNLNIPELNDFDQSIPEKELQILLNFNKGIKNMLTQLGGGSPDAFGSTDTMGMGGEEEDMGFDMGGGMEEEPFPMTSEETPTPPAVTTPPVEQESNAPVSDNTTTTASQSGGFTSPPLE